jgi:hypothetical protein
MTFTDLSPDQRLILIPIMDGICLDAGIELDSAEREQVASLVMRLFWARHRTSDALGGNRRCDSTGRVHGPGYLQRRVA